MLQSAKNDAENAIATEKANSIHRRQLSSWKILARLEVIYFPKKGKPAILSLCKIVVVQEYEYTDSRKPPDAPGDNILTEDNFLEIHRIEKIVLRRPGYGQRYSQKLERRNFIVEAV